MALNMSNADYGRSQGGNNVLTISLDSQFDNLAKFFNVESGAYKKLVTSIRNIWSGEDAERFIKELDSQMTNIQNNVKTWRTEVRSAIENDYKEFKSFQSKNNITLD